MFQFKTYVPDVALADVIVLNEPEYQKFLELIALSNFMEGNNTTKEQKQEYLLGMDKSREPFLWKNDDKDFDFLTRKYSIEERVGDIIHEKVAEKHEVYCRRYLTLRANAKRR